ncbi:hypothetical protein SCLCIDRAFT_9508 [Scleroderma citrinum Foug A]|uniref:Uncharacterized protein n=1 Tax=Scleroderma citrinum Foug A TaxID=1036808 RepID=A0A0C3DZ67_9AGAM|nr:hypothetical protein SCLCIDRAFT_9508 [Scleroderma citrinum Foug A]
MYYASQVKPDDSLNPLAHNICNLHGKFAQEIQDEVMCIHSKQSSSKNNMPVLEDEDQAHLELDAETCQSNIQQCGPALKDILIHLSRKTGWSFLILMDGPNPTDHQERKNKLGLNFTESYAAFNSTIVQVHMEFLDSKYDCDLDGENVLVSHKDDGIHANTCTSVHDKAGIEDANGTQNPDDSNDDEADDHRDGNEQDGIEDDGHGDGNGQDNVKDNEDRDFRMAEEAVSLCLDSVTDVAMSVANTLTCLSIATPPSVAVPVFQAVAMPSHGASPIAPSPSTISTAPALQPFM